MTTIHACTPTTRVLTDVYHSDLRRARSATQSMIPTKTGAAAAVGLVLPELNGKLDGYAVRVRPSTCRLVDLTLTPPRKTSAEDRRHPACGRDRRTQGRARLQRGAAGLDRLQPQPAQLDLRGDADKVIDGTLVKVLAWYDNEWGFSNRMLDTTLAMMKAGA